MSRTRLRNVREPSEVEAWKLMMDSMVKFIAASTKLMKTISTRAEMAVTPIDSSEFNSCEVECIMCPTRSAKECGVCAAGKPLDVSKTKPSPSPAKSPSRPPSAVPPPPPAPAEPADTPTVEPTDEGAAEPTTEATVEAPADETTQEEEAPKEPEAAETPAETVGAGEPDKPSEPDVPQQDSKKNYCVCPEVRVIKEEASKAGVEVGKGSKKDGKSCKCAGKGKKKGKSASVPANIEGEKKIPCTCPDENAEKLCTCPVGNAEKEQMTMDLAKKLDQAQENLSMLQMEMARLQQMDALKNSQSAALYREIMKDSTLDRSSLTRTGGPSSAPSSAPTSADWQQTPVRPRPPGSPKSAVSASPRGFTARRKLGYDDQPCTQSTCAQKHSFRDTSLRQGHQSAGPGLRSSVEPVSQGYTRGSFPEPTSLAPADMSAAYYAPSRRCPKYAEQDYYTPDVNETFMGPNDDMGHNFQSHGTHHDSSFTPTQNMQQSYFSPTMTSSVLETPTNQYVSPVYASTPKQRYIPLTPGTSPELYGKQKFCPAACFTESQNDYMNPEFGSESQEFPDDICYDDNCEDQCI